MPLALARETMEMQWKAPMGKQSGQILLEGDMIVPDSRPDLEEILRCEGRILLKDRRISEDRISFSGELETEVLYRAKNGEKPLYAMKSALPLEDFLHMDGLEKDMDVKLEGKLEHLDCHIINDRKISLKAVILMEAEAEQKKKAEILTEAQGEGMEVLKDTLQMESVTGEMKEHFTVREEMTLPATCPEVGEGLLENVRLTEQDIRPMDRKVMVRGNLCVDLLYTDEEGNLGSVTEKIPFSGYLENEEITPKTDVTGVLTVEEYKLTPALDEDGETRQIGVDVTVGASLQGQEMKEQAILLDAYAPRGKVLLQKEEIVYPVTVSAGRNQFTLRERISLEPGELPMLKAETQWGKVQLSEAETGRDSVTAEGVFSADILYHCTDDGTPVAILSRNIPFLQTMALNGVSAGEEARVSFAIDDLDFQMFSETEGELRATMTMDAAVRRMERAEVVTDIQMEEEAEKGPRAGAVIYTVQKGDSLWKIAKKYRTTVADILAVNDMEHPDLIYPGQKLLIIRMQHEKA